MSEHDFHFLPDLASRALGGSVMWANDELFAERENLINVAPPTFQPHTFGHKGQIMDGWESRRRREPGHDEAIVRLGARRHRARHRRRHVALHRQLPARDLGRGAAASTATPTARRCYEGDWTTLVPRSPIHGDTQNEFAVDDPHRYTHVKLTMYPDGGVARLRVRGVVVPDPRLLPAVFDLAALENGGQVTGASNVFYSSPGNLIMPGNARVMGDGWETSRRRDDGNDWVDVELACAGDGRSSPSSTPRCFVGNAPGWARLSTPDGRELLPRTRAAARHPASVRRWPTRGADRAGPPRHLPRRRHGPVAADRSPDRGRTGALWTRFLDALPERSTVARQSDRRLTTRRWLADLNADTDPPALVADAARLLRGPVVDRRDPRRPSLRRRRRAVRRPPMRRPPPSTTTGLAQALAAHPRIGERAGRRRQRARLVAPGAGRHERRRRDAARRRWPTRTGATKPSSGRSTWSAPPACRPSELLAICLDRLGNDPRDRAGGRARRTGQDRPTSDWRKLMDPEPNSMSLSTHVLDASTGRPAAGVRSSCARPIGVDPARDRRHRRRRPHRATSTAPAGRPSTSSSSTPARYFAGHGVATFYPEVVVTFEVDRRRRPPSRAAAAEPVRLFHLSRELAMTIRLGDNQYGKAEIRLVRVDRNAATARDQRRQRLDVAARRVRRRRTRSATTATCSPPTPRRTPSTPSPSSSASSEIEEFALRLGRHFVDVVRRDQRRQDHDRGIRAGSGSRSTASRHDHAFTRVGGGTRTTVVTLDGADA